jgi:hypothetical protein
MDNPFEPPQTETPSRQVVRRKGKGPLSEEEYLIHETEQIFRGAGYLSLILIPSSGFLLWNLVVYITNRFDATQIQALLVVLLCVFGLLAIHAGLMLRTASALRKDFDRTYKRALVYSLMTAILLPPHGLIMGIIAYRRLRRLKAVREARLLLDPDELQNTTSDGNRPIGPLW